MTIIAINEIAITLIMRFIDFWSCNIVRNTNGWLLFPYPVSYHCTCKAVNAALKKAGINPAHVDSEEHIESNTKKGWLTPEQAEEARNIKKTVGEEKAATLNPTMIQNIANGRLAKFFKENCLVDQEFQFGDGDKQTVAQYLASQSKDLKIVAYQRFTLAAE